MTNDMTNDMTALALGSSERLGGNNAQTFNTAMQHQYSTVTPASTGSKSTAEALGLQGGSQGGGSKMSLWLTQQFDLLIARLRRRQVCGSHAVALETARFLRNYIAGSRWKEADVLIARIVHLGGLILTAQPTEFASYSMVQRIIHLIREEHRTLLGGSDDEMDDEDGGDTGNGVAGGGAGKGDEKHHRSGKKFTRERVDTDSYLANPDQENEDELVEMLLNEGPGNAKSQRTTRRPPGESLSDSRMGSSEHDTKSASEVAAAADSAAALKANLKSLIRQGIADIIDELENSTTNISAQALEHIHSNEIILTIGNSKTVDQFLKEAARYRKFQVIIAETAPSLQGHDLSVSLATSGIDCTVITDSAIFAIMSRVNKVILGTHAVTANGGLVAISGSHIVTLAAKLHSTPVVVLAPLHKLSPLYPYDVNALNVCQSPHPIQSFAQGSLMKVDYLNPNYDYITPDHVALFITNLGAHPPSYMQRLMADSYSPEDQK